MTAYLTWTLGKLELYTLHCPHKEIIKSYAINYSSTFYNLLAFSHEIHQERKKSLQKGMLPKSINNQRTVF